MEESVETPGKYQYKSKLESRQMVLGWFFFVFMELLKDVGWLAVVGRKGCPSKEGTSQQYQ